MKSGDAWTLPGVALDEEESVRDAALRALDEHCGDDLYTYVLGAAPVGVWDADADGYRREFVAKAIVVDPYAPGPPACAVRLGGEGRELDGYLADGPTRVHAETASTQLIDGVEVDVPARFRGERETRSRRIRVRRRQSGPRPVWSTDSARTASATRFRDASVAVMRRSRLQLEACARQGRGRGRGIADARSAAPRGVAARRRRAPSLHPNAPGAPRRRRRAPRGFRGRVRRRGGVGRRRRRRGSRRDARQRGVGRARAAAAAAAADAAGGAGGSAGSLRGEALERQAQVLDVVQQRRRGPPVMGAGAAAKSLLNSSVSRRSRANFKRGCSNALRCGARRPRAARGPPRRAC